MTLLRTCVGVGIFALATACSGGGSSGEDGDPTASLGAGNAEDVAGAVVRTAFASGDAGSLGGIGLGGGGGGGAGAGRGAPPELTTRDPFGPEEEACDVDGIVIVSGDVADPEEPSVGDQVQSDFDLCDTGDVVLDGGLDLEILALVGELFGDEFSVVFDLVMDMLSIDDGVDTLVLDGDGELGIDADPPLFTVSLAGSSLALTYGGETATLSNYTSSLATDDDQETYALSASGRMTHPDFEGSVDFETELDLEGEGDDDPDTGLLLIYGAFGAVMEVIPDENAVDVDLELDVDGNGTPENLIETTWAELMGDV